MLASSIISLPPVIIPSEAIIRVKLEKEFFDCCCLLEKDKKCFLTFPGRIVLKFEFFLFFGSLIVELLFGGLKTGAPSRPVVFFRA